MMADGNQAANRRAEILASAQKVFDAHGYAATTVEAVAEGAGIAKGSIYNYFESKQELFRAVFTEALVEELRRLILNPSVSQV